MADGGGVPVPGDDPSSFATIADVRDRGTDIPEADGPSWTVTLGDVSDALRARGRRFGYDLDAAIAAGRVTKRTATRVTVAIARRFRTTPRGPQITQQTGGPFSRSFSPSDVEMYVRADELADLGVPTVAGPRGTMGDDPTVLDVYSQRPTSGWPCSPLG